ncbi:MAG TPA: carboxypeptidase-like regulatory domain-containing protein [Bryobacteraceae bacterium]|nr:carboxypeptidase-like regulatory domain-containing protein [Bryobacteraceae bacterium]
MSRQGTVEGRVLRTSGEPLGKAQVGLGLAQPFSPVKYVAITGANGRFSIPNIEAGQYRVSVSRNGFVNLSSDPLWHDGATVLTIAEGSTIGNIEFRMAPQCVISGRLMDEDGEALPDIPVTLLREMPMEHETTNWWPGAGQVGTTNDLGEFRIAGLRPGKYVLGANCIPHMGVQGQRRLGPADAAAWPPTYYPGTGDLKLAEPIEIAEGQDLRGLEMQLRKVRAFRVSGRLELPANADPRGWSVHLGPHHAGHAPWMPPADEAEVRFDFGGVLAGPYMLVAHCQEGKQRRTTQMPVEVADSDVDGLVVTFPSGSTLKGFVRSAEDPARFDPTTVHISLRPESAGVLFGNTTAEPSGEFAVHDLSPGRYQVSIHRMWEHGYVQSIRYAGEDVRGGLIEIRPEGALGLLEIVIAFDGGEIAGVLQDATGDPRPNSNVRLLEDPPRFDQFRSTRTDQNGRFWFRDVAPASHWIFAVEESAVSGVALADRWERHEGAAQRLTVQAGGQHDVIVRLPK